MSEPIVEIRRYPNRRLYDRSRGEYVTLAEIEQLVLGGKSIVVRDSKTDEDLTRLILTQLLIERHPDKLALFPPAMLHQILRADEAMTDLFRSYFRSIVEALDRVSASARMAMPFGDPAAWMRMMFPYVAKGPSPRETSAEPDESPSDAPPEEPRAAELEKEALLEKMRELEERVRQLERPQRAQAKPK